MQSVELFKGTAEILAGVKSERVRGKLVHDFTVLFIRLNPRFDPPRFHEAIEAFETINDLSIPRKI